MSLSEALEELNENRPLSKMFKMQHTTVSIASTKTHAELTENNPSKMFESCNKHYLFLLPVPQNSASQKRKTTREDSSPVRPPPKVNWVLASPKGDEWNPFIGDTLVSDSVKQQWSNRFAMFMNNKTSAPFSV